MRDAVPSSAAPDEVILLHGLGRTWRSMRPVGRALQRAGFVTHNIGYPSRRHRLPVLAEMVAERIARVAPRRPPHFVGHSLGCILIRYLLAHRPELRGGRVVLLTPPNQGARAADFFQPYVSWLLRPLPDLSVAGGIAAGLALPAGIEVGLIAGGTDRTVRLHETRLDGAADTAIVPCGHSFIMLRRDAQDLTVRFLRTGRFSP
ncbi:MAG TPA: alpha/beta fold hydrolase [Candidatus Polarisedimenticolia bacterium]|nr:alpha/beta fold hydrolase [Candidatus Polarisedimenticolia bacterium]